MPQLDLHRRSDASQELVNEDSSELLRFVESDESLDETDCLATDIPLDTPLFRWLASDDDVIDANSSAAVDVCQRLEDELDEVVATILPENFQQSSNSQTLQLIVQMAAIIIQAGVDRTYDFHTIFNDKLLILLDHISKSNLIQKILDLISFCMVDSWLEAMDEAISGGDLIALSAAIDVASKTLSKGKDDWAATHMFIYQWLFTEVKPDSRRNKYLADFYNGSTTSGSQRRWTYDKAFDGEKEVDHYVTKRAKRYLTHTSTISADLSVLKPFIFVLLAVKPVLDTAHMFVFNTVAVFSTGPTHLGRPEAASTVVDCMVRFVQHCRSKFVRLPQFPVSPANRGLPICELIHVPWSREELDCLETEFKLLMANTNLREGVKELDKTLSEILNRQLGTGRSRSAVAVARRSQGLFMIDRKTIYQLLGLEHRATEVDALMFKLSAQQMSIEDWTIAMSSGLGIPTFSKAIASRLRQAAYANGVNVSATSLRSSRVAKKTGLHSLDGIKMVLAWLRGFDARSSEFPWKRPSEWGKALAKDGLELLKQDVKGFLVPVELRDTAARDKMGQEAFRQAIIRHVQSIVRRAESNADGVVVLVDSRGGRYVGPGERRVILRIGFRQLATAAIIDENFRKVSWQKSEVEAALGTAFPNGYQDGKNLSGKSLGDRLNNTQTAPLNGMTVDQDSFRSVLCEPIQRELYRRLELHKRLNARTMSVEEATDFLVVQKFSYSGAKKAFVQPLDTSDAQPSETTAPGPEPSPAAASSKPTSKGQTRRRSVPSKPAKLRKRRSADPADTSEDDDYIIKEAEDEADNNNNPPKRRNTGTRRATLDRYLE